MDNILSKIHRLFFMAFDDSNLEERYLIHNRDVTADYIRLVSLIGAAIIIGFLWQDTQISKDGIKATYIRLFAALPLSGVTWYASRNVRLRQFIPYTCILFWIGYTCVTTAIFLVYEPGPYGLTSTTGLGSFLMVIFGIFAFSNLSFWLSLMICLGNLFIYTFSVAWWTATEFSKFLEGDFLTIFAVLSGCATLNLFNEHARRKQFMTSELLRDLHEKLEQQISDRTAELRISNEKLTVKINEHMSTEEALIESNERFSNAFENAPIMMSISSLDDSICLDVNQRFVDVAGYSKEEIIGKSFIELGVIASADKEKILVALKEDKRIYDLELNFRSKHGKELIWNYSGQIITIGGNKYVLSASMDITEQRLFEQHLRQSQKMEAIGQMAGGMAHDFNNILTVIMGYGQMLKMDESLTVGAQEAIDQIISSSEKAARLTGGMLAFSRKQNLTLEYENLNNIVHHVQKFLVRIIGEDIDLKTISNKANVTVRVDIGQIEQVLMNLATNARDAMPKGGVLTIKTDIQNIDSSFIEGNGFGVSGVYAVLSFSDTGSGISKEHQKRIFDPFFTTKEVGKGTGLGMAIVYGIVRQHNGFIDVNSEPGEGTTFRIFLPIIESADELQKEAPEMMLPDGGFETILLAEDDPDVRKFVGGILNKYGYDVIYAVDGQDAIDKFIENKENIRLILMDMIMPKKNGKEAYEIIRMVQPGMKILYSSGYTSNYIKDRGVSEEAIEIVMKPVNPMVLLQKIRIVLDS